MANELTKPDRRKPLSNQLKAALDSMVEEGLMWDEAAVKQGMHVRSMRLALKRPHVIAYLRNARQVFLASVGAGNLRRLAQLRDQDDNRNAAVAAARTIEGIITETGGSPNSIGTGRAGYVIDLTEPGLQIVITERVPAPKQEDDPLLIDVTPVRSDG
jgi:hypothetical protein